MVAGVLLTTATTLAPVGAFADQSTLHSRDGSAGIHGEILSYDDGRYEIATDLGVLTLSARVVSCSGLNCPSDAAIQQDLSTDVMMRDGALQPEGYCPLSGDPLISQPASS